jgi:hypothetical protein
LDNTEVSEIEAIDSLIEEANNNIELGKSLERLKKNRDFKKIIDKIFFEDGKKALWANIQAYEEAEMLNKGSVKVENIDAFKGELEARLRFERFLTHVSNEAESAVVGLEELTEAKDKIIKEGE